MSEWVHVGALEDFPEGRGRAVMVAGVKVGVFKLAGRVYALKDACPHMGASLADGKLVPASGTDGRGNEVTCFWHGWTFDLVSGRTRQSSWACAAVYGVELRGGGVWLLPPKAPVKERPEPEVDDWVPFDPERHIKKKIAED